MREAAAFRIEKFGVAVADPQLPTTDGSAGGVGSCGQEGGGNLRAGNLPGHYS